MSRPWDYGVRWYTDLITAPDSDDLVVSVAYVRDNHLRITNGSAEDAAITQKILAATEQAEHFTQRALLPQTWALVLDRFPCWEIRLPRPPLMEVTSIVYTDDDGVAQTLNSSLYRVVRQLGPKARRSTIEPAYGETWPSAREQRDAVTITYRAGYVETVGASPEVANVPESIKEGIAMRAAEFYKQRSDSVVGFGITVAPAIVASRNLWHDFRCY